MVLNPNNGAATIYMNDRIDDKFKIFFKEYTSECTKVMNGIKNGFYEITNTRLIVKTYNSCD